jgi:putative protease
MIIGPTTGVYEDTLSEIRVDLKAVEAIKNGEFTEEKVAAWTERLRSVYNRDFWDGYYLGRKTGEWTQRYGSQATKTKVFVGTVTNFFGKINVAEIKMETQDLKVGDDIMIIGPTTGVYEDTLSEIRVDLKAVESTEKGELCSIPVKDTIRRGDKVYKVIDAVI